MNYAKLCKILPLCDSPVDAEALAALRALARALAPETFGDIARLVAEAFVAAPAEPEPAKPAEPFRGFSPANQPPRPMKPPCPGPGWIWNERAWLWREAPKPLYIERFQTLVWNDVLFVWTIKTDYSAVSSAAMEVMNGKLSRSDKAKMTSIFVSAMAETQISHSDLTHLDTLVRYTTLHPQPTV